MALANLSKPSAPSFTNIARENISETWSTMTAIWSAELRTWADTISKMDNISRVSASITNTAKPS